MSEGVEEFVSGLPEEVERVARALRSRIRDLVPEAVERRHGGWKILGYSLDGSMKTTICAIAPHSRHVNLQFFHGVELDDPERPLEGSGKRARHVKCHTVDDVERNALVPLIRQSVELARSAAQG